MSFIRFNMQPSPPPSSQPLQYCPLCHGHNISFVLEGKDRLHGMEGSWLLYRCNDCDLGFLNPIPSEKEIAGFYPTDYYSYSTPTLPQKPRNPIKSFEFTIRQARRDGYAKTLGYPIKNRYAKPVALLASLFPAASDIPPYVKKGVLLDIGCGAGHYLLEMKTMGWSVQGVEFSPHAVKAANEAGLDVFCGSLEEAGFDTSQFAVARLSDVLEHVPDPEKLLLEIHRILISKGKLQITLPNLDSWTFRIFKSYWFPLEAPRHLYSFTPRSLTMLAERCGYTIKSLKVWSHKEVDFIGSLQYLLEERYPHLHSAIDKPWIWKVIRKLSAPFKALANLFGKGSAMTVWLEKRE